MVDVLTLGTGTPIPVPGRCGAATAVVGLEEGWLVVDCGRGATQRAIDAGLDLTAVVAVLLTHHHSDHLSDLATFAAARWTAGASEPLTVIAPTGPSSRFAEMCLDGFDDRSFYGQALARSGPRPTVRVDGFEPSHDVATVWASGAWTIESVLVDHHPVEPAVGYRMSDGSSRVAVSGDTAICPGVAALAADVDVLVHEALLTDRVPASLLSWNAGARAVGELAAATQPGQLVLTHLIPAPTTAQDEETYLAEVRDGGYDGPTVVARDLTRLGPRG